MLLHSQLLNWWSQLKVSHRPLLWPGWTDIIVLIVISICVGNTMVLEQLKAISVNVRSFSFMVVLEQLEAISVSGGVTRFGFITISLRLCLTLLSYYSVCCVGIKVNNKREGEKTEVNPGSNSASIERNKSHPVADVIALYEQIQDLHKDLQQEKNAAKQQLEKEKLALKSKLQQELTSVKNKLEQQIKNLEQQIEKQKEWEVETQNLHVLHLKHEQVTNEKQVLESYCIHPDSVGAALIISIREVSLNGETKVREYAEKDECILENTLKETGFRILNVVCNPNKRTIMDCLKTLDDKIEENDGMFLCFIASHGGCDAQFGEFVYSSNGKRIHIEDLCAEIAKCKKLKGKPKVLLVNACLGTKREKVTNKSQTSALSDFLISFSCAPRHESYDEMPHSLEPPPNKEQCTVFVEALCNALKGWNNEVDLHTSILRNVHCKIQAREIRIIEDHKVSMVRQCPFVLCSLGDRILLSNGNPQPRDHLATFDLQAHTQ